MKRREKRSTRLLLEELEPRILHSADLAVLVSPAALVQVAEIRLVDSSPRVMEGAAAAVAAAAAPRELAIVDSAVADYRQLVADLEASSNGTLEVFVLDRATDGVEQISNILATRHDIQTIHIVSHGSAGALQLGAGVLAADTLSQSAAALAGWAGALTPDADILIYGCDVAAGPDGRAFVDALSRLTGADVAASDDLTGNAARGGDWNLEYATGRIESSVAIDAATQRAWTGTLAIAADAASSAATAGAQSVLTFSHTVGTGTDRLLVVEVSTSSTASVSSVTYGGVALTPLAAVTDGANNVRAEMWYLIAPSSGAANVVVSLSSGHEFVAGATSFSGVDQSATFGTPVTAEGAGGAPSVTVASAVGDTVLDVVALKDRNTGAAGGGQSALWTNTTGAAGADAWGGSSRADGAPSVTMGWSSAGGGGGEWAAIAVALKAAAQAAPVLTGANALTAIAEDAYTSPGTLVSALLSGHVTDANAGASSGIAVTTVDNTNGTWQYSTDGGTAWSAFGSPAAGTARLLAADSVTYVRFVPAPNWNGAAGLTFRAWDQTSGTAGGTADTTASGGASAFSSTTAVSNITVNAVNDAPTVTDRALVFDGTDAVTVAAQPNLVATSTLTMEARVQRTGPLGVNRQIILNKEGEYEIAISPTGTLQWAFADTAPGWTWTDTGIALAADTWVDVAVTFNSGVVNAYIDGSLAYTYAGSGNIGDAHPTMNDLTIGARQNSTGERFTGLIDEVRVWNVERSAAQIQAAHATALAGNEAGLVGYWRFDESSGTTATDSSTQGYDGVLGNGVAANAPARTTNLDYTTAEDTALAVAAQGVLTRATDPDGNALTATLVTGPAHAAAFTLNADGSFSYTPTANYNGADSFVFTAGDGSLSSTPATVRLTVTAVNDAPVLVGTNDMAGINRNPVSNPGTLVADLVSGHVSDADAASLSGIAVTAVDNTNGAWQYSIDGGSTWSAFGAPGAATARLLAADVATFVRFVPIANFSGTVANGLTYKAWDQTSGLAGGTADTTGSGGATAFSAATASASITVTAANTAPTLTGSNNLAAVNEDAVTNGGTLVSALIAGFTSDADPGALTGIAVTAVDNTNGAWQYSLDNGAVWTAFGSPTASSARLLAADAGTYVRFVPNADWNGTVANGITFRAWDRSTGVAGSTADTTGLSGTFRDNFQTASYSNNDGTLSWTGSWIETDSQGGGAASGRFEITSGVLAMQAGNTGDNIYREVNLSGATAATLSFTYASGLKNNAVVHIQISGDGGASYTTLAGGVFDASTNTFAGSRSFDITSSIASNTRVRWYVAAGEGAADSNSFWLGNLQITASGHNGGGTAFSTATAASAVTVNPVNDAPVRTAGALSSLTVLEDAAATSLGLSALAYAPGGGGDEAAQTLTYTVTALPSALGAVTLTDGTTAVTANTGYTLSQLQGMKFKAAANASGGPSTFSWTVADSGGTANGGVDTLAQSLTVTVTAVNDAPSGTATTITTAEDSAYTFSAADFGFSDVSDTPANALANVRLSSVPGAGTLALSGVAVTAGQFVPVAAINAGNLRFTPAANANGAAYASFTFQVQDNGGVANGGVDTDPSARSMTVNVTSVNDAPAGASTTVTTLEGAAYTFSTADFGYTDSADSNALLNVKIASVPGAGSLTLSGVAVASGQFVSAARIAAGDLRFNPATDANGAGYASFTFQVQDDDGIANGGVDTDPTARSMTVNVTSVNDAPAGASKTVTTLEDTAYTFGTADFGFTDPADSNTLLNVKIVTPPGAGSLTLSGAAVVNGQFVSAASIDAGNLKFNPAANANGAGYASFTFQVQDDGGVANGGVDTDPTPRTMTVDVTAVNDAPAGTARTVTTLEDTAYTFSTADFGYSDSADAAPNALLAVRIAAVPAAGSLTLSGVAVANGQFVSAASIDAGNLKFNPATNANGAGYSSFTFQVRDDGGVANGGADIDATPRVMTVDVTSVNDAPAGANTTVTTREDVAYTFSAADFGYTDADANALLNVKIATLQTAGSLTLAGAAVTAGQFVPAASIAAGDLKFTPAANANGAAYSSFTFQVQDDGGVANGGIDTDASARTMTVDVTSVNDAPAGADRTVATLEDTRYTFTAADFGFTDPNDANALLAVRIASVPAAGGLTLAGVAVASGQLVSAASIAAGDLQFVPAANASGAAYASFTFQVRDDGGTGNGGVDLDPTPKTITIDVTAVNDSPVASNRSVTMLEDGAYTFSAADFGFADPADAAGPGANALSAVRISTLPLAGTLACDFVPVTAGQLVSLADLNAGKLIYIPAANANGANYASFTFQVKDDGGVANGGADLDAVARTMSVNVTAVNDAPAGANNTVTTREDVPYTFSAADFGYTDAHDSNALLSVKVATLPAAGTLTLAGVAVTSGQSVAAAALAAGDFKFTPAQDRSGAAYASFTFQVQDDGGLANGGADTDATARTLTVNVTSVNDAPAGASNTVATLEDTAYVFRTADFGFSDTADSNALLNVKIGAQPGAGSLTLDGVAVASGQSISAADIAAGALRFDPAADANGAAYASFTFQVQDDGGTANGGIDLASASTMTITVTPVNDAPAGTDASVATLEDTAYTFSAADFGFSDRDGNALLAVKIGALPATGSLTLAGVAVSAGDVVSAASIAAGDLKFNPAANASGAAYARFTFQVEDDGGTANAGADTDPVARTMIVNVTSVNDAPAGMNATVSTREDIAYTFAAADFGFTDAVDPAPNALLAVKIGAISGGGTFTLAGAPVAVGQFIPAARIGAGELQFTPERSGTGAGYATITFQVRDDGGTANGGVDTGAPRTLTVDVIRTRFPADAGLPVFVAEPAAPPQPAPAAASGETTESATDARAPTTLAKIAASLSEALAQTRMIAGNDVDAQVSELEPAPQREADAAVLRSPASSLSARADGNQPVLAAPDLTFEAKPEAARLVLVPTVGGGARAAAAAAAAESSTDTDAKEQAHAVLTLENGVRASAIIVSAGLVSWTLHGAGLIASLLTSAPAWRHLDPLPVLAPEEEKPDWGENDGDAQREEAAADNLWRIT
jgi:hypothetical protein